MEHIRFAVETGQLRNTGFDDIKFIHKSIPNLDVTDVSLDCEVGGLSLSSPIFINAMTGGGGESTIEANRSLAIAARETGIAMAVGSQMAALKDPSERKSYEIVRKVNPNGVLIANLGAEATVEQAKAAIEMIGANAIQIHLNVVQELAMPEGDRNFSGVLERIANVVKFVDVPVIVKEVGFGMSRETVTALAGIGVKVVDVGGFGGTNFAKIENLRNTRAKPYFEDWGIPTSISILEATNTECEIDVIASGGIQTSLDVAKSLALGAKMVGMAGFLLKILIENNLETLIESIEDLHEDLSFIMTALGTLNVEMLKRKPLMISGHTHHWLNERKICTKTYSNR
ncbi:isopentenyl-diphosphate delta-isomerase [Bacillus sp. UNCCL13]|nr:isopentenyl-diphosphate delta-isomerase [Bacillus sp. UNCCL13]